MIPDTMNATLLYFLSLGIIRVFPLFSLRQPCLMGALFKEKITWSEHRIIKITDKKEIIPWRKTMTLSLLEVA